MRVELDTQAFTPMSVKLTIESLEERNSLRMLCCWLVNETLTRSYTPAARSLDTDEMRPSKEEYVRIIDMFLEDLGGIL